MLHAEGILSGFVYVDANADGTRDAGELGVPGVVIRLSENDASDASTDRTTITDDSGFYSFDELEPGTYQISERQTSALLDGEDSTPMPDVVSANDIFSNVVLADDQDLDDNNFGERGLRAEFISVLWFLASTPPPQQMLRETLARSEELAGNSTLADSIRAGGGDIPDDANANPVANDDAYTVDENGVLVIDAQEGVLANDRDSDGGLLTASRVTDPDRGTVTLNSDGSFLYAPDTGFSGSDSFTYRANDAAATSNVATVRINVRPADVVGNEPFGPVTPGSVDDPSLRGTRMDTQPGAPPFSEAHSAAAVDYSAFGGNPPSYGAHHGFLLDAQNNSITPRPTGVYFTEQPDEDLVHNLEHGHVWISYNPGSISNTDLSALERLVEDGGTDAGVILTPRSKNTSPIVLTSWTRQLTLNSFDAITIRDFVVTNRGHTPEGYIPSGQKTAESESLDDGLPHSP
jgi:hypothetical protein